jgi:hypothetical protein
MADIYFNNGEMGFLVNNYGFTSNVTFKTLKSGKLSKIPIIEHIYFTPLRECELCGKISTPKKIQYRTRCFGWGKENKHDYEFKTHGMLCMRCWNIVERLICNKERQIKELNKLTNKLLDICRVINNGKYSIERPS